MDKLQDLRDEMGPLFITSGYRSLTHPSEAKKDRPGPHTHGRACEGVPFLSADSLQMDEHGFRLSGAVVDVAGGMLCPLPMIGRGLGQCFALPWQEHIDLFKERFAHVRSPTRELPIDGRSPRLRYENQSEKTSAFRRYNRTLRFSSWLSFEARRRHVMV